MVRLSIRNSAAVLLRFSITSSALAQSDADDANKSNNPLNRAASFNLEDYYVPSPHGASVHTSFAGQNSRATYSPSPQSPSAFPACQAAGISAPPASQHSIGSTAAITSPLASVRAKHGKAARRSKTHLSTRHIRWRTRERVCHAGRYSPASIRRSASRYDNSRGAKK